MCMWWTQWLSKGCDRLKDYEIEHNFFFVIQFKRLKIITFSLMSTWSSLNSHCENITKIFYDFLFTFSYCIPRPYLLPFPAVVSAAWGRVFSTAEIISHCHGCPARLSLSLEPPLVFEESVKTCHLPFLSCSQVMAPDRLGSWLIFFADSCYITGFPDLRHHQPNVARQEFNTISKSL